MSDDDLLTFADEAPADIAASAHHGWRILIIDDDEQVHSATLFALKDLVVHGRPLHFLHAYSADEARTMLEANADVAVIFLDVVMESEDTGLRMVKVIREDLQLREARIILRTGQPGYAPEVEVISNYDINDYRTKSELTRTRLITSLTAAIRSYEQIQTISESRRGLEKIVHASAALFERRALEGFAEGVLTQIASVLGIPANGVVCAQRGDPFDTSDRDHLYVISAVGRYAAQIGHPIEEIDDGHIRDEISRCMNDRRSLVHGTTSVIYLTFEDREAAVYIDSPVSLAPLDRQLLEVFTANISVGYANVHLFQRLNHLAYFDTLTGLPNRRRLIEELVVLRAAGGAPLTLCVVDIDHFSDINDALGSTFGDLLLVAATRRLREVMPEDVALARISGDIFAVAGASASVAPEALIGVFREPFMLDDDLPLTVSASLGVVRLEGASWRAEEVVQQALIAVGRAKRQTRGEYIEYSDAMARESRTRLGLLHELRMAMRLKRMALYFQPQIELASGRVIGAEALLRWQRDDGSFVPPDQFIPLAERSGLIVELGEWVVNEACRQLLEWTYAGLGDLRMAINVSMPQFRAGLFAPRLRRLIEQHGLTASTLEIEITESMVMQDVEATIEALAALKEVGVGIAIDDFGTGFSSLAYLQRLPVDVMKIDRAFVREIGSGGSGERIAEMVAALGHTLQLKTVAEGVETAEQAAVVRRWGCHFAQGFHYSPAIESKAFIAWVRDYHERLGCA
jgi:diguanylate cyclase (GGDEF)-like protein